MGQALQRLLHTHRGVRVRESLSALAGTLGQLLLIFGPVLALPAVVGLCFAEDKAALAFALTGLFTALVGWLLSRHCRHATLNMREAVLLCTSAWLLCSLIAALPITVAARTDYLDALFECVSGLTTTGLSALSNLSLQPHTVLFWRSESQLLGAWASCPCFCS